MARHPPIVERLLCHALRVTPVEFPYAEAFEEGEDGFLRLIPQSESATQAAYAAWLRAPRRAHLARRTAEEIHQAVYRLDTHQRNLRWLVDRHRPRSLARKLDRARLVVAVSPYIDYEASTTSFECMLYDEDFTGERYPLTWLEVYAVGDHDDRAISAWADGMVDCDEAAGTYALRVPTAALTRHIAAEAIARWIVDTLEFLPQQDTIVYGSWPVVQLPAEWRAENLRFPDYETDELVDARELRREHKRCLRAARALERAVSTTMPGRSATARLTRLGVRIKKGFLTKDLGTGAYVIRRVPRKRRTT